MLIYFLIKLGGRFTVPSLSVPIQIPEGLDPQQSGLHYSSNTSLTTPPYVHNE